MNLFYHLRYAFRERETQKYASLLLCRKVRLRDIPPQLLEDCCTTRLLHIYAFRADRGTSLDWFQEDLFFLEKIELENARKSGNTELACRLGQCLDNAKWQLNYLLERRELEQGKTTI